MASNKGCGALWEKLAPMPTKRVYSAPVDVDGILYVVGGCDSLGKPIDTLESYDPKKNKWRRLANMPTPRAGPAVVAVDGCIVAIGGVGHDQVPVNRVEMYNVKTKTWSLLKPLYEEIMGVSAVVFENNVIVIGGMKKNTDPSSKVTVLDIKENVWHELPDLLTPRYATASYLVNRKLYVLGGRHGKKATTAFEMLDLDLSVDDRKWVKLSDIPSKRVFPCYASSDTHFFSVGGLHENPQSRDTNDRFSNVMESYDIEKDEWTVNTPMFTKRGDFSAAYLNGKVIAAVGMSNQGNALTEVEAFDLTTNQWEKVEAASVAQCSCASVVFKNRLLIIGGLSNQGPCNHIQSYGIKTKSS